MSFRMPCRTCPLLETCNPVLELLKLTRLMYNTDNPTFWMCGEVDWRLRVGFLKKVPNSSHTKARIASKVSVQNSSPNKSIVFHHTVKSPLCHGKSRTSSYSKPPLYLNEVGHQFHVLPYTDSTNKLHVD